MNQPRIKLGLRQMIGAQAQVLFALMLRDIKTRWGSTPAYVTTFLFPVVHIMILVGIWSALGRVAPYGDSNILWFSVCMVPFMTFSYVSRYLVIQMLHNRPVLSFPIFKVTDIVLTGTILETMNSFMVILTMFVILWFLNVDFMPYSIQQAVLAMMASILLGLGYGIINALIGAILHVWVTGYFLFIIALWITSGVMFLPSSLPDTVRNLLFFQPTVHLVEWMREAYYPGYISPILNKTFIVGHALSCIVCGLAIERFVRGKLLSS